MPNRSIRLKSSLRRLAARLPLALVLAAPSLLWAREGTPIDYQLVRPQVVAPPPVVVVKYSPPEPLPLVIVGSSSTPRQSSEERVFADIMAAERRASALGRQSSPRTPEEPGFARQRELIKL